MVYQQIEDKKCRPRPPTKACDFLKWLLFWMIFNCSLIYKIDCFLEGSRIAVIVLCKHTFKNYSQREVTLLCNTFTACRMHLWCCVTAGITLLTIMILILAEAALRGITWNRSWYYISIVHYAYFDHLWRK